MRHHFPKPNDVDRADDERVLRLLRLRSQMSSVDAATRVGKSSAFVRTVTQRVRAADLAESGEAEDVVMAGYAWPGTVGAAYARD